MSNNDDFDFNRDDLFGDDDFGDDSGGDDFTGDDFDFGDDSDDFSLDDDDFSSDLDSALGGDEDDFGGDGDDDFATTESTSGGGTSRGFIIIGAIMAIGIFLGLGIIIWALFFQEDPALIAFEQTRAAIETANAIAQTDIAASATVAIENATATEAAAQINATGTEQAILDATASYVPPTETPTTDFAATDAQGTADVLATQSAIETQIAIDATNTEISFQLTLNPSFEPPTQEIIATETIEGAGTEGAPLGGSPVPISAVQQTATALAELFSTPPTQSGGGAVATSVVGGTDVVIGGATQQPGQGGGGDNGELPETGLFDDVFQGNPTFIFLAAFGLLGVIVFSRSVRSRKRDE